MKTAPTSKKRKRIRTASKTTAAYWSAKIRLEKKPGWVSSNYFVRIQAHGTRRKLKLDSTVKETAAQEAAELYLQILSNGWPEEEASGISIPNASSQLPTNPTISDWCAAVRAKYVAAPKTINKYEEALQTIVGEIMGTPRARKPELRAKIREFPVSSLTKKSLKDWLAARVAAALKRDENDISAQKSALNTARTLIVNARSLFSADILEKLEIGLDATPYVPFEGLKLPKKNHQRYTGRFEPRLLLKTAARELGEPGENGADADSRFEQWKILYLALVAGLRYNEIDQLRIQDMMLGSCKISIRPHGTFHPKTEDSVGDVKIGSGAAKVLEAMIDRTSGPWFIKTGRSGKSTAYRAGIYHDAVVGWLRAYKVGKIHPFEELHKPLHELRKEAGSLVNHEHGLVAAQHFLRHRSISTTAGSYVDTKGDVTTGLD